MLLTGDADALFGVDHQRPLAAAMPFAEWRRISGADHVSPSIAAYSCAP
jgi:hypothetical protein